MIYVHANFPNSDGILSILLNFLIGILIKLFPDYQFLYINAHPQWDVLWYGIYVCLLAFSCPAHTIEVQNHQTFVSWHNLGRQCVALKTSITVTFTMMWQNSCWAHNWIIIWPRIIKIRQLMHLWKVCCTLHYILYTELFLCHRYLCKHLIITCTSVNPNKNKN